MSHLEPRRPRTRAKITAAVGILTMLFGALLVLAPGASAHGADAHQNDPSLWDIEFVGAALDLNNDTVFTYELMRTPETGTTADDQLSHIELGAFCIAPSDVKPAFDETDKWNAANSSSGQTYEITFDGDYTAAIDPSGSTWILKKGSEDIPDHGVVDGEKTVTSSGPDCTVTPTLPTLTVEKAVVGTAPAAAAYAVDVSAGDVLVEDDEPISPTLDYTRVGAASYDLTESVTSGADSVAWACFRTGEATPFATSATATIDDVDVTKTDARCVVTNTFTPPPPPPPPPPTTCADRGDCPPPPPPPPAEVEDASLTIVKAVTGETIPEEWTFGFDGGDELSTFELTNTDDSITFEELDAGEYTVAEPDDGVATLASIDCGEDADDVVDLETGSVTVDLAAGDDVTCTFTNNYETEVLGETVVPPVVEPKTVTPVVDPAPVAKVLDSTVTRTLPRTGDESQRLALVGLCLVLFGAVLVGGSRRRLRVMS